MDIGKYWNNIEKVIKVEDNFAAISSSYNVIKPFNFIIKVKKENYKIQNK